MKVWMYFHTDGDSGYYAIQLFSTKAKAEAWKRKDNDAYGGIQEKIIDAAAPLAVEPREE